MTPLPYLSAAARSWTCSRCGRRSLLLFGSDPAAVEVKPETSICAVCAAPVYVAALRAEYAAVLVQLRAAGFPAGDPAIAAEATRQMLEIRRWYLAAKRSAR